MVLDASLDGLNEEMRSLRQQGRYSEAVAQPFGLETWCRNAWARVIPNTRAP